MDLGFRGHAVVTTRPHIPTHSLCVSLCLSHTHTLSLSHTHTHTISLSLSLCLPRGSAAVGEEPLAAGTVMIAVSPFSCVGNNTYSIAQAARERDSVSACVCVRVRD